MKNQSLRSEVELNQKLILVGDVLYYTDNSNCMKYQVIDLFEGGFEATSDNDGIEFFMFNELQHGWSISENTKQKNSIEKRFTYIN